MRRRGLPLEVLEEKNRVKKFVKSKEHLDMMDETSRRLREIRKTGNNNAFRNK